MAKENVAKQLLVERESYKKDGQDFFSYFVRGQIRGKEVKARVSPSDMGGYDLLDIVFLKDETAELVITPGEMTDDKGQVVKFTSYECRNIDKETGETFSAKIKPQRPSDKAILEMLAK